MWSSLPALRSIGHLFVWVMVASSQHVKRKGVWRAKETLNECVLLTGSRPCQRPVGNWQSSPPKVKLREIVKSSSDLNASVTSVCKTEQPQLPSPNVYSLKPSTYRHLLPNLANSSPVLYLMKTQSPNWHCIRGHTAFLSVCLCICPFFIPSPPLVRLLGFQVITMQKERLE